MEVNTDPAKIARLLNRGVENIYPSKEALEEVLYSGKRIRLFQGFDPTGPFLHIGHAIGMRKLAEFQALGHEVIFLMGDFTGMIGDPEGKAETRKQLTREQALENLKNWKEQASRVLDFEHPTNPIKILFNYDWLSKLNFEDVLELTSKLTVQQMIERDMFQERIKAGRPIGLHEFLYPLMQGYDSVAMDVDLEVGGTDQTFNMLVGRTLVKAINKKEKFVLTNKILTDPTGKKMGKSEGNMITLVDEPKDIYGKVMSFTDGQIAPGFELLTEMELSVLETVKKEMEDGANPIKFKKQLAFEVVKWLAGEEEAVEAQSYFEEAHQQKVTPTQIAEAEVEEGMWRLPELIFDQLHFTESRGEAKRLVQQGGVSINDVKITDHAEKVEVKKGDVLKVGKTKIVKIA